MKFDIIIGNPPYNIRSKSESSVTGTSGNSTFYRKFTDFAFKYKNEDGIIALLIHRGNIRYMDKKGYPCTLLKLETKEYWEYNAYYFISISNNNSTQIIDKSILSKTVALSKNDGFTFSSAIGGSYESILKSSKTSLKKIDNYSPAILDLPNNGRNEIVKGYCKVNGKSMEKGSKVIFKALDSEYGFLSTELPHYVGSACTFYLDNIDDAKSLELFIRNSKLVKYIKKVFNENGRGLTVRWFKKFDLSQIKTGYEYPREYNLTDKEIKLIEDTIK